MWCWGWRGEAMATTGTVCRLPAGPQGPPAGPPPPWERQGSCSPCPESAQCWQRRGRGWYRDRQQKEKDAESQVGQLDGEEAMLWLLPPFLYHWHFHAGCCQKPLPFCKRITSLLLSQVNQIQLLEQVTQLLMSCLSGPACHC